MKHIATTSLDCLFIEDDEADTHYLDRLRVHLENLLNTRQTSKIKQLKAHQLDDSLLAYGLPDLSQFDPDSSDDQTRISQAVTQAISHFEPRLHDIEVDVLKDNNAKSFTLKLQINALLKQTHGNASVSFISELNPADGAIAVGEFHA